MDFLQNFVTGTFLVLYYFVESLVLWIIPKRLRYKNIAGKTVLITGAGSGIGRQLSLEFARRGCRLILLDLGLKSIEETRDIVVKTLQKEVDIFLYKCDVSNREVVYSVAAKIKEEVGTVTILVNNAGVITGKLFLDCPDDMIQKTMDVNIMAHFWTCKAFLPDMKASGHGHIVFIASLAGIIPAPKMADYCASKHAVFGFAETLRMELDYEGYTGVKTTIVAPSLVATGLFDGFSFPLAFPLTPENVAKEVTAAVLVDQEVILLPEWTSCLLVLKAIFPRAVNRQLQKSTKFANCMDNFRGRKKEN